MWSIAMVVLACALPKLITSLILYPGRHLGSFNSGHMKMRNIHHAKRGLYPAHAPAKALSPVLSKPRDHRRLEVMLPSVEGVDLETLTDRVLDTCPGVISVSAELVTEKTHNQESVDTMGTDRTDVFQTWESHVQGTGAWLAALVRLQVLPSFQINNLEQLLHSAYPALPFTITEPERGAEEGDAEENWILKVQQSWPPQRIGNLTVYFPWHTRSSGADHEAKVTVEDTSVSKFSNTTEVELVLEGGAAFGTGDHPTTRMCVNWLSRIFQQKRCIESREKNAEKWSLLDYGCGSAILALAGLRFGAATATGVDIDVDSLHSAQRNYQLNNLRVDLYLTDPDNTEVFEELRGERLLEPTAVEKISPSLLAGKFDVTVANIIAPVLIALASKLAAFTKPGGKVALSGVLAFQAEAVIAAYNSYFDNVCVEDVEGEWVLITGVRKAQ